MGRIIKDMVAKRGAVSIEAPARIDSGADITLLATADAKAIGFDPCVGKFTAISGVEGSRVIGREFEIELTVGARRATVKAVVPLLRIGKRGKLAGVTRKQTLIGHDFLQATKAKLDYSKPHDKVFSGDWPDWNLVTPTKKDREALDKFLSCPRKKRGPK